MKEEANHSVKKAMWLSLIPGLGQFYNQQKLKGLILFVGFLLEIIEIVTFGIPAIQGLITLGTTPMKDHSLFLLIEGAIQLIALSLIHI